jgi:hypothetical protein
MIARLTILASAILAIIMVSCKSSETKSNVPFCTDSACIKDPLKFESNEKDKPFVVIKFKDCKIDSIHWEKGGMGVIKDIVFSEFMEKDIRISKSKISCQIIGNKYAWIKLNDCNTGRGFAIKLPFDKSGTTSKLTSAINNFDPAFKIEEGLFAYYDNTFIYVQDMATDKIAKILLTDTGVRDIDYNDVHSLIESVNITKDHIKATLNFEGKKIEHDQPLVFKQASE